MTIETGTTTYGSTNDPAINVQQALEVPHATDRAGAYRFRVYETESGRGMATWLTLWDLHSLSAHLGRLIEDAEAKE